jgi:hypothetical protein
LSHDPLGVISPSLSQKHGRFGRATTAYQCGERRDHHQGRHADANSRQGERTFVWDVADVDPVNHVVQHVDQLGRHCGNGQAEQQGTDRRGGQEL